MCEMQRSQNYLQMMQIFNFADDIILKVQNLKISAQISDHLYPLYILLVERDLLQAGKDALIVLCPLLQIHLLNAIRKLFPDLPSGKLYPDDHFIFEENLLFSADLA